MASQQPIFRTIEVGVDQHITLGEPLTPDVRALMDPAPVGAVQLTMRMGTFGHAESIIVDLDSPDGPVRQIEFTYRSTPTYRELVAAYTQELGPPSNETVPNTQQSTVWNDGSTRFEVWTRDGDLGSLLGNLLPANS